MVHRIIQQHTANIHYFLHKNEASDELVIFLHGAYGDHTCFNQQIEPFTTRYNVILIDLMGHGLSNVFTMKDRIDSTPEQIQRILEVEKFNKAHFVGVSLGGALAQYVALKYPEIISSLVITGSYNINELNEEINKSQKEIMRKNMWMGLLSINKFRRFIADQIVYTPENKELYYKMSQRFIRKSFFALKGLKNIYVERPDTPCDYPLLILCGAFDFEPIKTSAIRWHEQILGSQYHTIPSAAHIANMDNPQVFNEIVLDFFASL